MEEMCGSFLNNLNLLEIEPDHLQVMEVPIGIGEIVDTIGRLKTDKAPRPDGLTAEFYKKFNLQIPPYLQELFNHV